MISFFPAINKFKIISVILYLILSFSEVYGQSVLSQPKPRLIITADPELDDNNSLIRLLLYASDIEIEGLIYASSQFHWKGDGKGTKWFVPGREYDRFGMNECPCESWRWNKEERFIHDIVDVYELVYSNLMIHEPNYPSPALLRSKIRYGNIDFEGDFSQDSPGSELIKELILDEKPEPLFITAWGGGSTIARALKSIQEEFEFTVKWREIREKISRKVILLPSGDQDDTFATYISPMWPDIEIRQFSQGPNYGYGAQLRATPENAPFLTSSWMKENVSEQGALGKLYRVWGDGKQMVKGDKVDYFGFADYTNEQLKEMGYFVWMPVQEKGSWLGEGDNHTFMNMLGNGLRAYEKGYFGGWGGRELEIQNKAAVGGMALEGSAEDMAKRLSSMDSLNTVGQGFPNFFPAAQRDFAARLKWSVTEKFENANHAPIVSIEGPLILKAIPGQKIKLNAWTSDPDEDVVTVEWFQIPVVTFHGEVVFSQNKGLKTEIIIPENSLSGQSIHVVLAATDQGSPSLTSYRRVVIMID